MHIHKSIYTHIFHSMWTPQTSTRYVWEAEPGVPDELAFPASLVTPARLKIDTSVLICKTDY